MVFLVEAGILKINLSLFLNLFFCIHGNTKLKTKNQFVSLFKPFLLTGQNSSYVNYVNYDEYVYIS